MYCMVINKDAYSVCDSIVKARKLGLKWANETGEWSVIYKLNPDGSMGKIVDDIKPTNPRYKWK